VNPKQIWQAALGELQLEVSASNYETFLRRTTVVSRDGDVFLVAAPNTFVKEWIEARLLPRIAATLSRIVGHQVEARVVVHQRTQRAGQAAGRGQAERDLELAPPAAVASGTTAPQPARSATDGTVLNPRYTFERFIVGKSNQFAFAAAEAVADRPGEKYNPLFIYGAVGLGKTHLLHAIGHRVRDRGLEALYVTSERFTNDMISAIRERRNEEFRQRYRRADVLLVDDIQFIAGKESTQEEFFHTFNALHEANRAIVICSDRPPKSIATLEERLRSRFEWGLIADIQPPDYETRVAILREKAKELGLTSVPPDVLEYIARTAQSSIRELEGSLNRVLARAEIANRPLSLDLAKAALSDLVSPPERRFITPQLVVEAVGRYYKVEPRALRGKARDKETVLPRQVAMYILRKETDSSLVEIGRELGGRDHSTVLHGLERIEAEMEIDSRLRSDLAEITQALYNQSRR